MVYIDRNGKVFSEQPWGLSRIYSMFMKFIMAIVFFVKSLIDPLISGNGASSSKDRRSFFGFGSGGGGGGGDNGPKPRRPMGRINHSADVTVPGGCSSCRG